MSGSQQRILVVFFGIVLLCLVAVAYRHVPDNAFHYDELENIVNRNELHLADLSLDSLVAAAEGGLLKSRVLPNVSFAVDWYRGAGSPKPFLYTNLAIHMMVSLAVFALLLAILRHCIGKNDTPVVAGAFLGAAFWALHPIQLQAVTYIVQRMASLAALFVIVSIYSYLRARLTSSRVRILWYILAVIGFLLGVISKENALVTPVLIVLVEFGVVRHGQKLSRNSRDWFWLGVPACVVSIAVLHLIIGLDFLPNLEEGFQKYDYSMAQRILTQPRVIVFHLTQIIWPTPSRFAIVHEFPFSVSMLNPITTLWAMLTAVGVFLAGVRLTFSRELRVVGFLLLWLPVTLVIESSFLPLRMVFEHRMYLPSVGLAGLLSLALVTLFRMESTKIRYSVATVLVLGLFSLGWSTAKRSQVWRDDLTLWTDVVKKYPESAEGNNNIGWIHWKQGDLVQAIPFYEAAVRNNPNYPESVLNLARSYAGVNRIPEAMYMFERARVLIPDYPDLHFSLGMTYIQVGDFRNAIAAFETTLQLNPDHGQAPMFLRYARGQMPAKQ